MLALACGPAAHGRSFATTDGGRSWSPGGAMGIVPGPLAWDGRGAAALSLGGSTLALSADGGVNWHEAHLPSGVGCVGVARRGSDIWLACERGARGQLWHSTDGGASWKARSSPVALSGVALTAGGVLWLTASGSGEPVWTSIDQGRTWRAVWPSLPAFGPAS